MVESENSDHVLKLLLWKVSVHTHLNIARDLSHVLDISTCSRDIIISNETTCLLDPDYSFIFVLQSDLDLFVCLCLCD